MQNQINVATSTKTSASQIRINPDVVGNVLDYEDRRRGISALSHIYATSKICPVKRTAQKVKDSHFNYIVSLGPYNLRLRKKKPIKNNCSFVSANESIYSIAMIHNWTSFVGKS